MKKISSNHEKNKKEFSKVLLIQESVLIWVTTIAFVLLAALCIIKDYTGSLPWVTALVGLPWTAYGVSQCFYYEKSKKENTVGGIKYDTVMTELTERCKTTSNNILEPSNNKGEDEPINLDYGI